MCKAMEDMIADFVTDDRKETALRMLEDEALSKEKIAKYLNLPLEVVDELANSFQSV